MTQAQMIGKTEQIAAISARLAQPSRRLHQELTKRLELGLVEGWLTADTERAVRAMIAGLESKAAQFGWRGNR